MKVWIDVGAHIGQSSFAQAQGDPNLQVYAFEPLLPQAAQLFNKLPNYQVIPMAVREVTGFTPFYIPAYEQASSALPFDHEGIKKWVGGEEFYNIQCVHVPCIRLDTFITLYGLKEIDFLKIDAQGSDLEVVKSLGRLITIVKRIQLEVTVTPFELYQGASKKGEITGYLDQCGFKLVETHKQSFDQEENLIFERQTV